MDEGQGFCLTLVQLVLLLKHHLPKIHLLFGGELELLNHHLADYARQGPSRTPGRRGVDLEDAGMLGQARRTFCAPFAVFLRVSSCSAEHSYPFKALCFHRRTFQLWHLFTCVQSPNIKVN